MAANSLPMRATDKALNRQLLSQEIATRESLPHLPDITVLQSSHVIQDRLSRLLMTCHHLMRVNETSLLSKIKGIYQLQLKTKTLVNVL